MMRKLIWRGMAVALMTGGVCWTAAQFKQCPGSAVARLLRSAVGGTKSAECCGERAPVIVDLSAPWSKDPDALFPEDNLKLEDVLPLQERSKQLDLIDLSLLSEAANPARPNYAEEEEAATAAVEPVPATASGPEAPHVALIETKPTAPRRLMPFTDEEGGARRYMPYADESEEAPIQLTGAIHSEEPPLAQEDPTIPYQYPGCLYLGPCPGSEKKGSPAPPKAKESPSTPGRDRGADARPSGLKYHVTLKKSVPIEDDSSPKHPEVDTMEFRPSDAGAVDFIHRRQIY